MIFVDINDAYAIAVEAHKNEQCVECLEYDDFFAFAFVDNKFKVDEVFGGGYDIVDKKTGKISVLASSDPALDTPLLEISAYNRDE